MANESALGHSEKYEGKKERKGVRRERERERERGRNRERVRV